MNSISSKAWQEVQTLAAENGLVLVRLSARRFMLIKRSHMGSIHHHSSGPFLTWEQGDIVCKGTWEQCVCHIAEHAKPVPSETVARTRDCRWESTIAEEDSDAQR